MRHYKKGRKLGTDSSHTKAIKKSLVAALFISDRIKTTLERAKEIRGDVDKIITLAKRGDVHARRLAIARLGSKELVAEIFTKVEQGMFKDRQGGYTRILKLGKRRGDSAVIVIMELASEPVSKKSKSNKADKPAKVTKVAAKSDEKTAEVDQATDLAKAEAAVVDEDELAVSETLPSEADAADETDAAVEAEPVSDESAADDSAADDSAAKTED